MCNALCLSIANWFMGQIENKLKSRQLFFKVWARYMDDVFAVVHKDRVLNLLVLLNSQHESIKDGKLSFLDVEVKRNGDSCSKSTESQSTKRFIINESHHSVQNMMATFKSMLHRAMGIPLTN
jgi:hypothetical protein